MNWLKLLGDSVKDTESPQEYWFWAGLFAIAVATQRNVWLDYGIEIVYPNLYVMEVAPPGETRKEPPMKLIEILLRAIGIEPFYDSATRRAISKHIAKKNADGHIGSLTIVSKELADLLANDIKGVIGILTSIYGCNDKWGHKTSTQGGDELFNVFPNVYMATTPNWLAENFPQEAVGGGWTSRIVILSGFVRNKLVSWPKAIPEEVLQRLISGLIKITTLSGAFTFEPEAKKVFDSWYDEINTRNWNGKDDRLRGYVSRSHISVLKVAMLLQIAELKEEYKVNLKNLETAIEIIEVIVATSHRAFNAYGNSINSFMKQAVLDQLKERARMKKPVSFSQLMKWNLRNLDKATLDGFIAEFTAAGYTTIIRDFETLGSNYIVQPLESILEED